jgi:hypothetical protein
VFGAAFAALLLPAAVAHGSSPPPAINPVPFVDGTSPISGVVRSAGRPIANATVVVRAFVDGVDSVVATLKSEEDGTFVVPAARQGLYTVLSFSPGFRPAIARVLHRQGSELVSLVAL